MAAARASVWWRPRRASAEARALYAARLRSAVREVEESLVALQSTAARSQDAQVAADGFAASYRAARALPGGLANLFELEDARRSAVQAQSALIDLQRGRGWPHGSPCTARLAVAGMPARPGPPTHLRPDRAPCRTRP